MLGHVGVRGERGGLVSECGKVSGATVQMQLKLAVVGTVGVGGIREVAEKSLDFTKNSD